MWKYLVFITVIGPIFTIVSLILSGTEDQNQSNAVTWEIAWTVLVYLGYEAASVWFVWKYTPYAAFFYDWNTYETDEERQAKAEEIRGY